VEIQKLAIGRIVEAKLGRRRLLSVSDRLKVDG